MEISQLPLNALRAFEASARLLSFTRAGLELHVSQTAVSHQVKALEEVLGVSLFERLPRGVALTDEGHALLPVLTDAFRRMSATLSRFEDGNFREVLTVGAVGTFATGWLLLRVRIVGPALPAVPTPSRCHRLAFAVLLAVGVALRIPSLDSALWYD